MRGRPTCPLPPIWHARLARDAEAVCRHYLSNGHRRGRYWVVGDTANTPGRSLYVRLYGADYGPGAAGKWTDAATGEHGDLLDLICRNREFYRLGDAMDEARAFLALPRPVFRDSRPTLGSSDTARRLFLAGGPVRDTHAGAYLRASWHHRASLDEPALRYHASLYYRENRHSPAHQFPALLAAVTDCHGRITGIQRTWLDSLAAGKGGDQGSTAGLGASSWAMACGLVRAEDVLAVGEGIETMLALRSVLPALPMIAALSANHFTALVLPPSVRAALHRPR